MCHAHRLWRGWREGHSAAARGGEVLVPGRHDAASMEQVPVGLVDLQQSFAAHIVQVKDSCLQSCRQVLDVPGLGMV